MPRQTLNRDAIVRAAVDLLDSEGLDGLSMRALGQRLGSAATAVYWHVGSRDNLVALAADRVWAEIALPDPATVGWRTAAMAMAVDLHAMLVRHLWLVQAFGSIVAYGPGKARHDDHLLAIYEAAGLSSAEADQAAASVFIFVLGNALCHAAQASLAGRLARDGGNAEEILRAARESARAVAADFPRLRERLRQAKADHAAAPDETFAFGLRALLDGVAERVPVSPVVETGEIAGSPAA